MSAKKTVQRISLISLLASMTWEAFRMAWEALKFLYLVGKAVSRWVSRFYWILIIADASGVGIAKVLLAILTELLEQAEALAEDFVRKIAKELAEIIGTYLPVVTAQQAVSQKANKAVCDFQKRVRREMRAALKAA